VKVELLVWPCQIIRFVACIPQVRKQTKYICFRFSIGQVEIGVNVDDNIEGATPLTIVKARNKTSNVSIYGFNVAKVAMEINIV
jgi:hypothetical protein